MNLRLVFIVCVVTFLFAEFTSFCQQAASQEQESGERTALRLDVANITGGSGQTVPMGISVTGAAENLYGFILIRGLPSRFKLSGGFLNGKDWLVSLSDLKTLRLAVPDDFAGHFDIEVILVLQGNEQRQTRSASVVIQQPPQPEPVKLPPVIPPEPDKSVTKGPTESLKSGETGAEGTSAPPFATNIESQPQTNPDNVPNSDKVPTEREVAEFCSRQLYICRKVCDLRSRNDFAGCPQRCESRAIRCNRTGCYKWTEPEYLIAESFGGQQCFR